MLDRTNLDPVRPRRRRTLLKEKFSASAIGIAFHHHCAIHQMRKQRWGYLGIIAKQSALGEAALVPKQLLQIREPYFAAIEHKCCVGNIIGDEVIGGWSGPA